MNRKRSSNRIIKDNKLLIRINELKQEHPLWGYRRIWAYMRFRDNQIVGKNRVYRVMKEADILVKKNDRLKAKRGPMKAKPKAIKPDEFWGIDMTKIKIGSFGWLYLHIVLDWFTKEIIGYSLSLQSKTDDWLDALNMAVNTRFSEGIRSKKEELFLVSDNGCQPISEKFMRSCNLLEIKQIFTSWNNPKGNADTERVMRTIKEDLIWINDWDNPFALGTALEKWIVAYNQDFPHQSLTYKTPSQFYDIKCL